MRKILSIALVVVTLAFAGVQTHAQESTGTPPGATTGLPFVNDNANQPVLQPLSPGAAPIEATHEGEAAEAGGTEHKKGLPQFDPSTFARQIFWLFLTFMFAYVVFSRKTLPLIGAVLETRRKRIAGDLQQAEKLKTEVEAVRAQYEAAIAKAQSDAANIINNLQGDIKKSIEAQDAAFKSRSEQAVAQLEMSVTANRTRAMAELNNLAAGLAVDITSRISGMKVDEGQARDAIDASQGNKAKAA